MHKKEYRWHIHYHCYLLYILLIYLGSKSFWRVSEYNDEYSQHILFWQWRCNLCLKTTKISLLHRFSGLYQLWFNIPIIKRKEKMYDSNKTVIFFYNWGLLHIANPTIISTSQDKFKYKPWLWFYCRYAYLLSILSLPEVIWRM